MAADASAGIDARAWEFDKIFCGTSAEGNTQEAVFKDTSLLITSAIDGFNVCIFAYGKFVVVILYYLQSAIGHQLIVYILFGNFFRSNGVGKGEYSHLHFFLVLNDDIFISRMAPTHISSLSPR